MLAGFDLRIKNDKPLASFYRRHKLEEIEARCTTISSALIDLLIRRPVIDAEKVANALFPIDSTCDIFLSHSSADRNLANQLAAALESLGLQVFVDSHAWGSVYDLLQHVDDIHCLNPGGTSYSYERRNASTAHVYMILNTALHRMIDRAEALIFLNTDKSLIKESTANIIGGGSKEKTQSAWIHSELHFSAFVRRHSRRTIRRIVFESATLAKSDFAIVHPAPIDHLFSLSETELYGWLRDARLSRSGHPLDKLYDAAPGLGILAE